jgi:hypothetical protein
MKEKYKEVELVEIDIPFEKRHPQRKIYNDKMDVRFTNDDVVFLQQLAIELRAKTGKHVTAGDVVRYAIKLFRQKFNI